MKNNLVKKIKLVKPIIPITLIIVFILLMTEYGGTLQKEIDVDKIQSFVESFDIWGMMIFIIIAVIRPFVFIPSTFIFILGGLVYGTVLGSILSLIGLLLGAISCYVLASRFQVLFSKLVGKKYVDKLEKLKEENTIRNLFMMRVTPAFPFDAISYGAGLTAVNFKDFLLGTILGSSPKVFLYTFLGDGIEDLFSFRTIAVFIILFILALFPVLLKWFKTY